MASADKTPGNLSLIDFDDDLDEGETASGVKPDVKPEVKHADQMTTKEGM